MASSRQRASAHRNADFGQRVSCAESREARVRRARRHAGPPGSCERGGAHAGVPGARSRGLPSCVRQTRSPSLSTRSSPPSRGRRRREGAALRPPPSEDAPSSGARHGGCRPAERSPLGRKAAARVVRAAGAGRRPCPGGALRSPRPSASSKVPSAPRGTALAGRRLWDSRSGDGGSGGRRCRARGGPGGCPPASSVTAGRVPSGRWVERPRPPSTPTVSRRSLLIAFFLVSCLETAVWNCVSREFS